MSASRAAEARQLTRDRSRALVAGVCAGFAARLDVDPVIVRVVFGLLVVVTGRCGSGRLRDPLDLHGRGGRRARPWGREPGRGRGPPDPGPQLEGRGRRRLPQRSPSSWSFATSASGGRTHPAGRWSWRPRAARFSGVSHGDAARSRRNRARPDPERGGRAEPDVQASRRSGSTTSTAVASASRLSSAPAALPLRQRCPRRARDVVLTIVVAILALGLILAPFLWRLGRNLAAERAERIRSQERAEMAAHLHDSVLQTLTLVQKRADDPREVAQLARARSASSATGSSRPTAADAGDSLAAALEAAAAEVEDAHRVPIEVVAVGDAPLDDAAKALVAAAREAMVNAAKFAPTRARSPSTPSSATARAQVFVRDRGAGFDPEAVPADRRGVRESIIGRMERSGGRAASAPAAGTGTEVELTIEPEAE